MNDASFALSVAYAALLAGLSYNSRVVKVYDLVAPSGAVAPYVIVGPWQGRSDNTKQSFGQTGEINLDIVTRFVGEQFSKKPASEIANQIAALLKPTPTAEVLAAPGFKLWNTRIVATPEIVDNTGTDRIYRKILTVEHSLWQL